MGGVAEVNAGDAVKKHLPWVRKLAQRYAHQKDGALFDDLVQEGSIAVMQAARTWRPDGGANLLTYATKYIRRRMARRVGRSPVVCRSNRDREKGVYELPVSVSMDAPRLFGKDSEDGDLTLHEHADFSTPAPQEAAVAAAERAAVVRKVLASLPARDCAIVTAVMGGTDYRTIGRQFGCSASLVEQLIKKWTPTLRKRLAKELSDDDRYAA